GGRVVLVAQDTGDTCHEEQVVDAQGAGDGGGDRVGVDVVDGAGAPAGLEVDAEGVDDGRVAARPQVVDQLGANADDVADEAEVDRLVAAAADAYGWAFSRAD